MRPSSSIEPFTPSASITLHPTLQAVLDNLDIQIEAELSRYRRQRRHPNTAPRRSVAAQTSPAIGILKQSIQLPQPRSSIYANPADASISQSVERPQAVLQAINPTVRSVVTEVAPSQPIQTWTAPVSTARAIPNSTPAHHPILSDPATPVAPLPPEPSSIASYADQYDLSAYAPDSVLQRLMQQLEPSVTTEPTASHLAAEVSDEYADYLASSEELLRSIAEESAIRYAEQEPNSLLDTLLTPLGIGSMLLLLLSSTTLGYVVMNPSSIGLKPMTQTSQPASEPQPANRLADHSQPTSSEAAPSPNLSAEEFLDLGLDTLSSIPKPVPMPPKPAVKGIAKPSKQTVKQTVSKPNGGRSAPVHAESKTRSTDLPIAAPELPSAPAVEPSLSTVVVPAQQPAVEPPKPTYHAAPKPVISPEPISVAPPPVELPVVESPTAPASSPEPQNRYYVVTDYSGDPSLRSARGAVPDAYVRNIPSQGAKVQLGSFSDQAQAEKLRQELQQRGIEAEVYHP